MSFISKNLNYLMILVELYLVAASALLLPLLRPEAKLVFYSFLISVRNDILAHTGMLTEGLNKV